MIITERTKRAIPFTPNDAKRVGGDCFHLDHIVWPNAAGSPAKPIRGRL